MIIQIEMSASIGKLVTQLFFRVPDDTHDIRSVMELGSNIGLNLQAIKILLPDCSFSAIEINSKVVDSLKELELLDEIYHQSVLDFTPSGKPYDLVLSKGVLIMKSFLMFMKSYTNHAAGTYWLQNIIVRPQWKLVIGGMIASCSKEILQVNCLIDTTI